MDMEDSLEERLKFNYYAMSQLPEFNYNQLAEELDSEISSDNEETFTLNSYLRTFNHSLFTPVLIYSLNFLKENIDNKEQNYNYIIGLNEINNIKILYVNLNKEIYDIFFQRTNKKVNNINIDFSEGNEEKYLIYKEKKFKDLNKKQIFKNYMLDNKEKELDLEKINYKELCLLKQKEIISSFRMGYSCQERIIEIFQRNKSFIELPNLIFFKKNQKKLFYNEYDRILLLKRKEEFELFKVYYSIENNQEKIFTNGEKLTLSEKSLNFLEVKKSISSFSAKLDRLKNNQNDEKSSKSLNTSLYYSINNINNFLRLYDNLNINKSEINLLYIFDSYYQFNMIKILKDIFEDEVKNYIDTSKINIFFIQINSDYEELDSLYKEDIYQQIKREMDELKEANKILNEKQKENEKKHQQMKENYEKQIKNCEENYEKQIKNCEENYKKQIENYENYINENKQKKIASKLIKQLFKDSEKSILNEIFGVNKQIDFLIGKNYTNNKIENTIDNLFCINENDNYSTLLDTKNFINNFSYSDPISNYFNKLKNIEKIVLLIETDFVTYFIKNESKFLNYNITGYSNNFNYFLLVFDSNIKEKQKKNNNIKITLKEFLIPSFGLNNEYIFNHYFLSYFKRVNDFINNMKSKKSDDIMIYSQNSDTFEFMVKYIYINNNDKKDQIFIYLVENWLFFENNTIEDYIKKNSNSDNIIIIKNKFNQNFDLKTIKKYFEILFNKEAQILELNINEKIKERFGMGDYILTDYTINNNEYIQLKDNKNNNIILTVKSKVIPKSKNKDDYQIKFGGTNKNFIKCIDINYTEEKLNLFLSTVLFTEEGKKEVLLLGDEFHYIKYFLSRYFITDLLDIYHIVENKKDWSGISEMLGLRKTKLYLSLNPLKHKEKEEPDNHFITKKPYEYLAEMKEGQFDIIIIDDNLKKYNSIPSFDYFENNINVLEKALKINGIISFNLYFKNQLVFDKLMKLFEEKFIIIKRKGIDCNWLFILVKKEKNNLSSIKGRIAKNISNKIIKNTIQSDIYRFASNLLDNNKI